MISVFVTFLTNNGVNSNLKVLYFKDTFILNPAPLLLHERKWIVWFKGFLKSFNNGCKRSYFPKNKRPRGGLHTLHTRLVNHITGFYLVREYNDAMSIHVYSNKDECIIYHRIK